MNPPSKLSQNTSSSSLSGGTSEQQSSKLKSPSSTITSFFSNIGQSLSGNSNANNAQSSHGNPLNASFYGRLNTPPPSPNAYSGPSADKNHFGSKTELTYHSYGRYAIKYIGSTGLRRRHTLPMLNWIVTDLLYQSKCDGDELHIKIRNCIKEEHGDSFERLRTQLTQETHHHGLNVQFDMCQLDKPDKPIQKSGLAISGNNGVDIAFQVTNAADGQMLLSHQFRRVFLFGKFTRESLLFYLHKEKVDAEAVPTLYVFQAKDETQVCVFNVTQTFEYLICIYF